jgi:hypothetical protein
MRICYVFPSRTRPNRFFSTLDNIRKLSESDNYFVWSKLDEDDPSMNNGEVKEKLKEYPEVTVKWGWSKNKIDAINRNLDDLPECDIIIIQSDDIVWDVAGFDKEIREAFVKYFPDLSGTIHYPEFNAKNRTIIVSILGVNLFRRLGYLYHPSFISVYADNHFTEMTRAIGKYVFIDKRIFSHLHPIWGVVPWDEQYRKTEAKENYRIDRETYLKLQANNYGL